MAESKAETVVAETNKRVDPRYPAAAIPGITAMRLSPGEAVTLVNISASGVLVEGKTRFVPGTRVTVHFEGTIKPNQIKARVVHCRCPPSAAADRCSTSRPSLLKAGWSCRWKSRRCRQALSHLPLRLKRRPRPRRARPRRLLRHLRRPRPSRVYNRW